MTEPKPPLDLNTRLSLRQKQTAVALGISERKLREITPQLTTVWIGRVRLYPVEALRNWLIEEAERQAEAVKNRNQIVKQSLRRVPNPGP